jgi:hypothetical protein
MSNCLVTKLKGRVDNDNLPKNGEFKLEVLDGSNGIGLFISNTDTSKGLYVTGNLTVDGGSSSDYKTTAYTIEGTTGYIHIPNKYTLSKLKGKDGTAKERLLFNLKDLKYMNNLAELIIPGSQNVKGDIAYFGQLPNIEKIQLDGPYIYGNIKSLKNSTQLTSVIITYSEIINGDIADLGNLTSLISFTFFGTSVGGSLESFVAGQISHGRTATASPILARRLLQYITFGGNKYIEDWSFITWESASKIVVYCGSQEFADCNKIYAKGATAEEIAAWEQAGKTVTIIS